MSDAEQCIEVVQKGDTYWGLMEGRGIDPRGYPGHAATWNPELADPSRIYPGDELRFCDPGAADEPVTDSLDVAPAAAATPVDDHERVPPAVWGEPDGVGPAAAAPEPAGAGYLPPWGDPRVGAYDPFAPDGGLSQPYP
jgi:hypothetical protein